MTDSVKVMSQMMINDSKEIFFFMVNKFMRLPDLPSLSLLLSRSGEYTNIFILVNDANIWKDAS